MQDVTGYAHERKQKFHKAAEAWLLKLAEALELTDYDVRSNRGGPAVSGEVTLHGHRVYVQLYESAVGPRGISVLYRECNGLNDYAGKRNHHVMLRSLAESQTLQETFLGHLDLWADPRR
jgi:hypothetical protein